MEEFSAKKLYNKAYYEKNKETIIKNLCKKVECPICKKKISFNQFKKHINRPICQRKANFEALLHNKVKEVDDLYK